MTEQEQVDLLLQRKEKIQNDANLSAEEKDKLLRKVRRDLRKIRGSSRTPTSESDDQSADEKPRRSRRERSQSETKDWRSDLEAFQNYKADLIMKLSDLGLELKDPADLINITVQGYDLALGYNDQISVDMLLQKFRDRWSNHEPKFFSLSGGDMMEILLMGPLPAGMVN